MHLKLFAAAGVAAVLLLSPARADASCCDQKMMSCCEKEIMPCCADKDAVQILMALAPLQNDPQLTPAAPARQVTDVWFMRPTFVGKSILQGHYIIEHDNDRMARGEPCTHIYAFDDRSKPVATFHCTHLEREPVSPGIAVVATKGDMLVLKEFQFAGDSASHGVPSVR